MWKLSSCVGPRLAWRVFPAWFADPIFIPEGSMQATWYKHALRLVLASLGKTAALRMPNSTHDALRVWGFAGV